MPAVNDDMDGRPSPSPPLPPDPAHPSLRKVQPFQEQYIAQSSPQIPPQHELPPSDLKRSNTGRSRATSRAPPVLHQPQPIKDAVNNAFDSSPVVQNQLDPELVRQVTEQVIRNLQQTANVATPTASVQPQQTQYAPPPPPPSVQPVARSPTQSSTDSIPQRYTPPSPEKRDRREEDSYGSPSPEPIYSDACSSYSRESRGSKASTQSRDTPKPQLPSDGASGPRRSNTSGRRRRDPGYDDDRPLRRDSGSQSTARDHSRPFRRDSKDSEASYYQSDSQSRTRRPRIPSEPSDPEEATTLEKIWKPLFENGNPTVRLSQFLRGLALHLIDDYEPKGSLVVTPMKMMRFFNETKVADEHYPWDIIFGGKMTPASLSTMYRKLLCQHHLVQVQNHELPSVPGLTPNGFEWFLTCMIQAHPDTEFERLARAVMNMPISNADDRKERFPKELSRRLLPYQPNLHAEQRLVASLNHEPYLVQLRGASNMPPPPPASAPPQQTSFTERERKPYSSTPFSNAVDDDDLGPTAMPIERERKPYTGREGMGKSYNNDNEPVREREGSRPATTQFRPEMSIPARRNSRSNSGLPSQAFYNNASDPTNIPPPASRHRTSNPPGPPPAMTNGSGPKGGRRATPPPRNPFARSEPMEVGSVPASQYASNLHPGIARDHFAGDPDEDTLRRYHTRRPTERNGNGNSGEDDTSGRGYPIPPRPPPSAQGYDSGYGSAGGPPAGSYPRGAADRRSTWYGSVNFGPSAGSGSDGYGSFAGNGGGYNPQAYGSSAQH